MVFEALKKNPLTSSLIANIFRSAHTLKGSGQTAGFDDLEIIHNDKLDATQE